MGWLLLIHQLPPKPIYLRAKIGARLARVGAVALKNSVYVLPDRDDCLEDFQWISEEAAAGSGSAFVWRAEVVSGITDEALKERFRGQATEGYESLKEEISAALAALRKQDSKDTESAGGALLRIKKKLQELTRIDFFDAEARKEAETMLRTLEDKLHPTRRAHPGRRSGTRIDRSDLVGRTWVTRSNPKIDRLASAWLIRRFIDPGARFRFDDRGDQREGEIGFDLVGGEFTHEGDRCTFETLIHRTGLSDPGLTQIAEIVHDVDLKDGKFARPDALGIQQLVGGLCQAHPRDEERLAQGLAFFDHLYASFGSGPGYETPPARKRKRSTRSK